MKLNHGDPELVKTAIKNKGFYGTNGIWNSIIKLPGDDHLYRERVETIVVRSGKEVFVKRQPNGKYVLPGGSTEKDATPIEQAVAECEEEAHIKVTDMRDPGISYKSIEEAHEWAKKMPVTWDGKYNHVFVGTYDGKYTGHVKKDDEDPFVRSGRWYSFKECFKFFRKEHRDALKWYIDNVLNASDDGDVTTEGYITTYFKNRKFLKKISNSPDIGRGAMVDIIRILKKKWDKTKNTSRVKRIQKDDEKRETVFVPAATLEFNDGCVINFAISYDNKSDTPAAATDTEEYGNLVLVYPSFFPMSLNTQIFTLLHEIGHIRLEHVKGVNQHRTFPVFGKPNTNEHRDKLANKGKVMYPEEYADLYAILNGANLYSILDLHLKKDEDKIYDYRTTNLEIANRYDKVYKDYSKLNPFVEMSESELIEEGVSDILYHGSHKNIKGDYLVPANESYEDGNYVFASSDRNFALCYAGSAWHDGIMNQSYYNGQLYITELKPGVFDKIFNTSGYIYEVDKDSSFKRQGNGGVDGEYKSKNKVKIIDKVYIKNILNELEKSDIKMYKYPDKPKFLYKVLANKKFKFEQTEVSYDAYGESVIVESFGSSIVFTEEKYEDCPIDQFGIPQTRSYPLNTKQRVYSACKLFGHCDKKYQRSLAINIFKAMKRYDIPKDYIGPKSKLYRYIDLY